MVAFKVESRLSKDCDSNGELVTEEEIVYCLGNSTSSSRIRSLREEDQDIRKITSLRKHQLAMNLESQL